MAKATTPAQAEVTPSASMSLASLGVSFDTASDYFLSKDEKEDILAATVLNEDGTVAEGIRFGVTQIDFETDAKFGDRYVLTVVPFDDPGAYSRGWQFEANETNKQTGKLQRGVIARNATLSALAEAMSRSGTKLAGPICFVERGQFRTIVDPLAGLRWPSTIVDPLAPAKVNGDELGF
jgi:hypothetical protein